MNAALLILPRPRPQSRNAGPRPHLRLPGALALVLLALLALVAEAAGTVAGKIVFVAGSVQVERGASRSAAPGDVIQVGDVIVTGDKSRAQLLMADGAKVALRAGTRYRVDELALPPAVNAPGQARTVAADGRSVATLLKGGFRTRTGTVGRKDPAAYEVRTPVGVLGIRGTEYVAVLCAGDCGDVPGLPPGQVIRDGLYLAVIEGRIVFRQAGQPERIINAGEVFFVPLDGAVVEQLRGQPAWLKGDGAGGLELAGLPQADGGPGGESGTAGTPPAGDDDLRERKGPAALPGNGSTPGGTEGTAPQLPVGGTDGQGNPVDLTPGGPRGSVPNQRRDLGFAAGGVGQSFIYSRVVENQPGEYQLDGNQNLAGFTADYPLAVPNPSATWAPGTAAIVESGADAATLLRWGRWSGGVGQAALGGQTETFDLTQSSLHWVVSDNAATPPALPAAGTVAYTLVGNTAPTNNFGQVGTLGSASFTADFTNQLVNSDLALTVGQNTWVATGTGPIGPQAGLPGHQFGGSYSVIINGQSGVPGSGEFSGFFSAPGSTVPTVPGGVGLTYTLADPDLVESVQGAAVFQAP